LNVLQQAASAAIARIVFMPTLSGITGIIPVVTDEYEENLRGVRGTLPGAGKLLPEPEEERR
jgi:hypothetical protein